MLYAGVDLGQRQDHSAIAVVERRNLYRAYDAPVLHSLVLRHVERAPLGTPYPRVVERVRQVVRAGLREGGCAVAVDATGVGAPVVDMLRASLSDAKLLGCELAAVSITGGERERLAGGVWSVPKRDLMAGVQLLLEKGELVIGRRLREVGALAKELVDVRVMLGGTGRVRMGAEGSGEHDDLVIALALACWRARRREVGLVGRRLPGI